MATLASVLTDPNYVNANPATKQAIFDKYAAQDANFANANPATQEAIRQRFGVAQARPSSAVDQIPGYGRPVPAAQIQQDAIPTRRQAIAQFIAPTVEALGTVGGAALGTAAGPAGTVAGAGVGGVAGAVITNGSAAGAAVGAVIGGVVGKEIEKKDKRQ
jgi:osmotically inducible lipoprotein OsmB